MSSEKDGKARILKILKEHDAETPAQSEAEPPSSKGHSISIKGHGNVVAGRDVHITVERPQPVIQVVKVQPSPGVLHIDERQAARIKELVQTVYETEAKLKQKPKDMRGVWTSLNKAMHVPSYRLIALADYPKAEKYLLTWVGRLHSMKSAPILDGDNWRKRHYAYIHANCKSCEEKAKLQDYLKRNFGGQGLSSLANDELEQVYRYAASIRARRAKK